LRPHLLIVADEHFDDDAAHASADRRHPGLHERVVGGNVPIPVTPGSHPVGASDEHDDTQEAEDQLASAPTPASGTGALGGD
jgi:hypothetical protein